MKYLNKIFVKEVIVVAVAVAVAVALENLTLMLGDVVDDDNDDVIFHSNCNSFH